MNIEANHPRSPLAIGGNKEGGIPPVVVQAPADVFAEGHRCSVGEARALSQTLRENLRNNFAKMAKELRDKQTPQDQIQAAFDAYVAEYDFGVSKGGGRRVAADPVDAEAYRIALDLTKAAFKKQGVNLKDNMEKLKSTAETVAARPEVRKRAESNVKATRQLEADIASGLTA